MIKNILSTDTHLVVHSSIQEDVCKMYDELKVKPKLSISADARRLHIGERTTTVKLFIAEFDDVSEALQWFSKIQYLYSVAPEAVLQFVHPETKVLYTLCELMYYMTGVEDEA